MTVSQLELLRLCASGEQTFALDSTEKINCIEFDRQTEELLELAEHQMIELAFHFNEMINGARHYTKIKVCNITDIGRNYLKQQTKPEERIEAADSAIIISAPDRLKIIRDLKDILEDRKLFHNEKVARSISYCKQIKKEIEKEEGLS